MNTVDCMKKVSLFFKRLLFYVLILRSRVLPKSSLSTSVQSVHLSAVHRIRILAYEVKIIIHKDEITFLLLRYGGKQGVFVRGHRYVIENLLPVNIVGIILQL